MYIVGSYGSGGEWRKISQSTRSPICFVVLTISVLISFILMASNVRRDKGVSHLKEKIADFVGTQGLRKNAIRNFGTA